MKRSQIILLSVFIVVTGVIYIQLKMNQKDDPKTLKAEDKTVYVAVATVTNEQHNMTMTSYGQVSPVTELMVAFEIQGKLLTGDINMKPGKSFSTGQILYKIEKDEAILNLEARKSALSTLILNLLPDIELDFPSERNKWMKFLTDLKPGKIFPPLPKIKTSKEQLFFMSHNVITEYYNVQLLDIRIEKYYYAAPFSGTVIEVYAEPSSIVNPGVQIAKIAKTGEFEIKVPISMDNLEVYKKESSASFINSSGKKVGTGKIIRISDVINQQTQSADVYYSVKALNGEKVYNGMYVNVAIDKEVTENSVLIPITAFKNGQVNTLVENKVVPVDVRVISSIPDSIYVTGLENGQKVLLDRLDQIQPKVIYKGLQPSKSNDE